jgi:hypothetical protein
MLVIHVGARARAGLEDIDGELVVVLAARHREGGGSDRLSHSVAQQAEFTVGAGCRRLDQAQASDKTPRQY